MTYHPSHTQIGHFMGRETVYCNFNSLRPSDAYGYAPVIRLKMAISGRHAHIHTDKTDISR